MYSLDGARDYMFDNDASFKTRLLSQLSYRTLSILFMLNHHTLRVPFRLTANLPIAFLGSASPTSSRSNFTIWCYVLLYKFSTIFIPPSRCMLSRRRFPSRVNLAWGPSGIMDHGFGMYLPHHCLAWIWGSPCCSFLMLNVHWTDIIIINYYVTMVWLFKNWKKIYSDIKFMI